MTQSEQSDLERALRQALHRVEPRPGFEARVLHALDESRRPRSPRLPYRPWWALASAAAAVFVLIAVGAVSYRTHVEAVRAEQTRTQVLEALRIANDKLDTAFRLVADQPGSDGSFPARDDRSGIDHRFN